MARESFGRSPNSNTVSSSSNSASSDIVDLKSREKHHLRLLTPDREAWRQYTLRHGNDPDSGTVRFVVQSRGDILSLKGFRSTRRWAVNVWNYDTGKIEALIGGPQIFQTFDDWADAGLDIMDADFTISRSGTGRDTRYTVIRMDSAPFKYADQVSEADLLDLSKYDNPPSDQELVRILEEMEIDLDAIKLPVPSLEDAKVMPCPMGKYKGVPMGEVVGEDRQYVEWIMGELEKNDDTARDFYVAFKVILTDGAYDPNNPDGSSEPPEKVMPKKPKKRAESEDLSEDELREKIKEALTRPEWSDFSKVIALFEQHTEPTKHDVSKCSSDELNALWNAVR